MTDTPPEVLEADAPEQLAAGTNQFVPWVPTVQTNMTAIATYIGDSRTANGVVAGVADPLIYNRAVHQGAFIAAGLAQFVANSGVNVMDDGSMSLATFVTNLTAALSAGAGPGSITNAKLANMNPGTVKANITGGATSPQDVTYAALLAAMGVTQAQFAHFQGQTIDTLTPNGWSPRSLTAQVFNNIPGMALSGGNIAGVPNGTYRVSASASGWAASTANPMEMKLRLRIPSGATIIVGMNTYSGASTSVADGITAGMDGMFQITTGPVTLELDSWQNANLTAGGVALGSGETDVYSNLVLTKVA